MALVVVLVFAAAFAGLAIWLFMARSRAGAELAIMAATETSSARDASGKAAGTLVELKGSLRTDAPLTSEFTQKACVWYRALTEREVERTGTDANGNNETTIEYETVTDTVRHAPTMLADASGAIAVDLEGAKVEGERVLQERGLPDPGGSIFRKITGMGRLAFRYTEWIIAADVPVYMLATVQAGGGVGRSDNKKQPFIVSIKSEEERRKSLGRSRIWLVLGGLLAAIACLGFLYVAWLISGIGMSS